MTTVYFIRHAESDNSVRDGAVRPLTQKGMRDRTLVTEYLSDKSIDTIFSSPYKRAVDTISDFAIKSGLEIKTVDDFRERKSDSDWLRDTDFWPFIERQWADFNYSLSDGECLAEVQERNIAALNDVLLKFARYQDKWLYCRAKTRDGFETAGGHIELGETPLDAAKRELFEETGAVKFDISHAFDYSVYLPSEFSHGQVFFAQIHELGSLPDYEMAEIRLFDTIPDKMRFPQILPTLYEKMQIWLNLQPTG